jgi:lipopolysaccharide assembly LptE-like protein
MQNVNCPHSALRNPHSAILALLCAAALLASPGCAGYQLGRRSLYRPDVRTVHVPMVQSDSYRRYLGERLTEAIVKEIELRTPYKVVDEASADSVLSVHLVSDTKRILANNSFSEPRDIETDFFLQTSWIDRRGDLIMSPNNVPASALLVNLGQQTNFVPEAGQSLVTAQQEAIQKLAQQIVGQMELAW